MKVSNLLSVEFYISVSAMGYCNYTLLIYTEIDRYGFFLIVLIQYHKLIILL